MIAKAAHGAHVCLRCQLRLSKQLALGVAVPARRKAPRGAREIHDEAATKEIEGIHNTTRKRTLHNPYRRLLNIGSKKLSEHPFGKLHGFRGRELREKHSVLDVDTLGTKSEVIVLRDAGLLFRSRPEIEEVTAEPVDILERVNAERGLPSWAEIVHNIDELRPTTQVLSTEEFKSVERMLHDGFTSSQLMKYMEGFETALKESDVESKGGQQYDLWTLGWMPGISETSNAFDEDALRGYISEAYTPKQRLVLQLLRLCWNVEVAEVIEDMGEIELHLNNLELELLISKHAHNSSYRNSC
jgi:hypothetical protein